MTTAKAQPLTLGWIGTGRMGSVLAARLLEQGCDLTVYNRTRSKAEPLEKRGARIVDRPADLSDRDLVITSVAGSRDFAEVMTGPQGLLANGERVPSLVIDTSTVSMEVSQAIREKAAQLGSALLAETTVLAERGGIARADYLEFINGSVMGSTFSRYKTPSLVNLDFTPTFTGHLLRKDFELGLDAARQLNVPLPVAALTHQIVVSLIGQGLGDCDFAALLELAARGANFPLKPESRQVSDGLDTE